MCIKDAGTYFLVLGKGVFEHWEMGKGNKL